MPHKKLPNPPEEVAGRAKFWRLVWSVKLLVVLIAAGSALTASLLAMFFAPRYGGLAALDMLSQPRAWAVATVAVLVCAVVAAALASRIIQPLDLLVARARLLLKEDIPTADGWPQARGEVGELIAVLRQVMLARETTHQAMFVMVNQLKAILTNASVGILFTRDGRFELVGRQMCLMVGYAEEELQGQLTRMIYPSDEAFAELGVRVREQFGTQGYFDGELLFMRKDGNTFWAHMLGRGVVANDASGGTIWIVEDVTQARAMREQLSWTATHDALTKLANRREFESRLGQALKQFEGRGICVMFIDLDRFKAINDTAGHAAGDEVLRQIANVLESKVRQSDTVSRLGGDEFAVLLPGCTQGRAEHIGEQIRADVERWSLTFEGRVLTVGASIGVVEVGRDLPDAAAVLNAADTACYTAKHKGKNRVETYVRTAQAD